MGWALDRSLAVQLAINALQKAVSNRNPRGQALFTIPIGEFNTPRPSGKVMDQHPTIASMSRLGNPWDNAKCESFMKTPEHEEIHANEYRDLEHLQKNITEFIENYYNARRPHSALGSKRRHNSSKRSRMTRRAEIRL